MEKIVIVGSGASGVHFARNILNKGYEVLMLDVGYERAPAVNPGDTFLDLKKNLEDPARYFLGERFESVIYPDEKSEFYGFPPNKAYIFDTAGRIDSRSNGFAPLFSFARGGLAEAWTGGVYPCNDAELRDFPFDYGDIEPYYAQVAAKIGIAGEDDDLSRFFPFHGNIGGPLRLDRHSGLLMERYATNRSRLNGELGCYLGRSRVATLSGDAGARKGCSYCGRCLWGCPTEALYTPSITLEECRSFPNFRYVPGVCVSHFRFDASGKVRSVLGTSTATGESREFPVDRLVLAAGTLCSSKIFMDSIHRDSGEVVTLTGLMDNRQILVPFVNLRMIGESYDPQNYQYHQLAMGLEAQRPEHYVHGQITTMKTALVHPVIEKLPLDLRRALYIFRNIRAALGVVNINLHDTRRADNCVTLEAGRSASLTRLLISYSPPAGEGEIIKQSVARVRKALLRLGCVAPPGQVHVRPMGASVHYSGTIPMSREKKRFTTSEFCRSHDFENLYIVDGTTFPFLPAKNLTFTLMANAARVADRAF